MICSADDFFTIAEGVYNFDPKNLPLAHQACFLKFLGLLDKGNIDQVLILSGVPGSGKSTWAKTANSPRLLIVDNTNLSAWEISPYYLAAQAYGFPVRVNRFLVPEGEEVATFNRQVHNVHFQAWGRMLSQFEKRDVLPWWEVQDL